VVAKPVHPLGTLDALSTRCPRWRVSLTD
jgi:hypothetical protein